MRTRAKAFYLQLKEKGLWIVGFLGFSFFANLYSGASKLDRVVLWAPGVLVTVVVLWLSLERAYVYGSRVLGRGIYERYADPQEADTVWSICRSFYTKDDHVINIDSLRDFMAASKRTAKIFYKDGKAVGLYIVFPIRTDAVRKYLDGTYMNAQALNRHHAVKDRGKACGLYVTNICAEGIVVRGKALESMLLDLRGRVTANPSIRYIFARMANGDGSRIIRKYGFRKIHDHLANEQVWVYHVKPNLPDGVEDLQPET